MSKKASRRFLGAAFLVSIALHLAGGGFLHWPQAQREDPLERISLSKRLVLHARPLSAASPPARAQRARAKAPALGTPIPRIIIPSVSHTGKGSRSLSKAGITGGAARPRARTASPFLAAPTAAPAPSASPAVTGCLKPNQPVAIVQKVFPLISKSAREAGTHAIARVHVTLSAEGAVTDAKLTDSSQNHELDIEALNAARTSTYSPAFTNCKPVAGETDYAVEFVPF